MLDCGMGEKIENSIIKQY